MKLRHGFFTTLASLSVSSALGGTDHCKLTLNSSSPIELAQETPTWRAAFERALHDFADSQLQLRPVGPESGSGAVVYFLEAPMPTEYGYEIVISENHRDPLVVAEQSRRILVLPRSMPSGDGLAEVVNQWLEGHPLSTQGRVTIQESRPDALGEGQTFTAVADRPIETSDAQSKKPTKEKRTREQRLAQLNDFIIERRNQPRLPSRSGDTEEQGLAQWLNSYRQSHRFDWFESLSEEAIMILKNNELLGHRRASPADHIRAVEKFILSHQIKQNGPPVEGPPVPQRRSVREWKRRQKDLFPEDWQESRGFRILKNQGLVDRRHVPNNPKRLQELSDFIVARQRRPRFPRIGAYKEAERTLAKWLRSHKKRMREKWFEGLSPEAIAILTDRRMLWRPLNKKPEAAILEEVASTEDHTQQ